MFYSVRTEHPSLDKKLCSESRVPGFDEYAFVLKRFFSNDGSPDPVECVVGCETTESEKGFLILPSIGAFVFLHTRVEWPTGLTT